MSNELQRYLERRRAEALGRADRADARAGRARQERNDAETRSYEAEADVHRAVARTYEQRLEELR